MRIVVKIGSSSLTTKQEIDLNKLQDHVHAIAQLKQQGHEVIVVSSGAVAAGFKKLGYPSRPVTIKGKQAAAAIGQSTLIQHYTEAFEQFKMPVAQILLTKDVFTHKKRYQNAFATLSELLERHVIPIINENDTVSIDELSFGDNDMLSSLVAAHLQADYLILLTDIDGLYTANPMTNKDAVKIEIVEDISPALFEMATGSSSKVGTGGMESKLHAAKYAMENGVDTFIGIGDGPGKFTKIIHNKGNGTYFKKTASANKTIHRWLALTNAKGQLYIDEGAYNAVTKHGKSLLHAGITNFTGHFEEGDVVEVYYNDQLIGRGEMNVSSTQLHTLLTTNEQLKDATITIHRNGWMKF